jgi:cytochrome c-type biogenesis protein CcmH/NrfG
MITAWRPVSIAQAELEHGDYAWMRGSVEAADRHFRAATDADSLSPEPWLRLAELEFSRRNRDAAENAIDEAIRRAPDRASFRQRKGQMLAEFARTPGNQDDWQTAGAAFTEAVQRHPTDAWLLAECAEALSHTNSAEAATMARRAIEQDDINHHRGHTDQYLPAPRRRALERIAKTG